MKTYVIVVATCPDAFTQDMNYIFRLICYIRWLLGLNDATNWSPVTKTLNVTTRLSPPRPVDHPIIFSFSETMTKSGYGYKMNYYPIVVLSNSG